MSKQGPKRIVAKVNYNASQNFNSWFNEEKDSTDKILDNKQQTNLDNSSQPNTNVKSTQNQVIQQSPTKIQDIKLTQTPIPTQIQSTVQTNTNNQTSVTDIKTNTQFTSQQQEKQQQIHVGKTSLISYNNNEQSNIQKQSTNQIQQKGINQVFNIEQYLKTDDQNHLSSIPLKPQQQQQSIIQTNQNETQSIQDINKVQQQFNPGQSNPTLNNKTITQVQVNLQLNPLNQYTEEVKSNINQAFNLDKKFNEKYTHNDLKVQQFPVKIQSPISTTDNIKTQNIQGQSPSVVQKVAPIQKASRKVPVVINNNPKSIFSAQQNNQQLNIQDIDFIQNQTKLEQQTQYQILSTQSKPQSLVQMHDKNLIQQQFDQPLYTQQQLSETVVQNQIVQQSVALKNQLVQEQSEYKIEQAENNIPQQTGNQQAIQSELHSKQLQEYQIEENKTQQESNIVVDYTYQTDQDQDVNDYYKDNLDNVDFFNNTQQYTTIDSTQQQQQYQNQGYFETSQQQQYNLNQAYDQQNIQLDEQEQNIIQYNTTSYEELNQNLEPDFQYEEDENYQYQQYQQQEQENNNFIQEYLKQEQIPTHYNYYSQQQQLQQQYQQIQFQQQQQQQYTYYNQDHTQDQQQIQKEIQTQQIPNKQIIFNNQQGFMILDKTQNSNTLRILRVNLEEDQIGNFPGPLGFEQDDNQIQISRQSISEYLNLLQQSEQIELKLIGLLLYEYTIRMSTDLFDYYGSNNLRDIIIYHFENLLQNSEQFIFSQEKGKILDELFEDQINVLDKYDLDYLMLVKFVIKAKQVECDDLNQQIVKKVLEKYSIDKNDPLYIISMIQISDYQTLFEEASSQQQYLFTILWTILKYGQYLESDVRHIFLSDFGMHIKTSNTYSASQFILIYVFQANLNEIFLKGVFYMKPTAQSAVLVETFYHVMRVVTKGNYDKKLKLVSMLFPYYMKIIDWFIDTNQHQKAYSYLNHIVSKRNLMPNITENTLTIHHLRNKKEFLLNALSGHSENNLKNSSQQAGNQVQSANEIGKKIFSYFNTAIDKLVKQTDTSKDNTKQQLHKESTTTQKEKEQPVQQKEPNFYYDNNLKQWIIEGQLPEEAPEQIEEKQTEKEPEPIPLPPPSTIKHTPKQEYEQNIASLHKPPINNTFGNVSVKANRSAPVRGTINRYIAPK